MSSVVLVEPISFGPDRGTKDNALIQSMNVSNAKAEMDHSRVCVLVDELATFFRKDCGLYTVVIHQSREPKISRVALENKGESVCVADNLSFHNFVNADGIIQRRVVVLYPMSPLRRGELARKLVLNRITSVAELDKTLELIDLRGFEDENKYLEGSGSLIFSPGGRYVYMAVSQRSHPDVLDTLCSHENLNIPKGNRFLLHAKETVPHTNVLGWCGNGVCAWCIRSLVFDSENEEVAFYDHLSATYTCVIELNEEEMHGFAGSAIEVPVQAVGAEATPLHYALAITESALAALSPKNRAALEDWYGADNIHAFYGEVLERRCGTSLPSCVAASYTHGPCPTAMKQQSTCELLHLGDDI